MTWTKLGDEFSDEARDLSDAEFRTHVEALCWSNRRGLDLLVPKRDLRRFAESPDGPAATEGLVAKGWWHDRGDAWHVGARFAEWQPERVAVDERKALARERQRRHRAHRAGDHSHCLPESCSVTHPVTRDGTRDGTRDVTGVVTPNVGTGREGLSDLPVPKKHSSRVRDEHDDDLLFDEFWMAYPVAGERGGRPGKAAALRAWLAARRGGADPAAIIKAASQYAAERAGKPPKYTPHASSWLNGRRYEDEAESAAPADGEYTGWMG